MTTYGLGHLITNNPATFPKLKENAIRFKELVLEDTSFASNVAKVFYDKRMKLKDYKLTDTGYEYSQGSQGDSKIFLNEPYIKITRLEKPKKEFF